MAGARRPTQERQQQWQVSIGVSGRRFHLGRFDDEEQAAREYDRVALRYKLHDRLNFQDYLVLGGGGRRPRPQGSVTGAAAGAGAGAASRKGTGAGVTGGGGGKRGGAGGAGPRGKALAGKAQLVVSGN